MAESTHLPDLLPGFGGAALVARAGAPVPRAAAGPADATATSESVPPIAHRLPGVVR